MSQDACVLAGGCSARCIRADAEAGDPPEVALQKQLLVTITLLILPAAFLWGMVYMAFGEPLAGLIPWGYGLVSLVGLATARWTGRFGLFRAIQLGMWLVLPFLLQIELGGFVPGSAVSVWAFCAPISALLVASRRTASALMVIFALLVVAAVFVQPLAGTSNALPAWLVAALFGLNLVGTAVVTYRAMVFFIVQKDQRVRPARVRAGAIGAAAAERAARADRRSSQEAGGRHRRPFRRGERAVRRHRRIHPPQRRHEC